MENISTFGLKAYINATRSLPVGYLLKKWADDAPSIQVQDSANGQACIDLNGKIFRWTEGSPLIVSLALIPDSLDDQMMSILYNENRATAMPEGDSVTLVVYYPTGAVRTFTRGRIVSGPSAPSALAEGRLAASIYTFAFEDQYTLSAVSALNSIARLAEQRARAFLGV